MDVIYLFLQQARVSVLGKPFQPSLMFVGKPRSTPQSEAPHPRVKRLKGASLRKAQAGKACQGQTLQLITKIRKLRPYKFVRIGPWGLYHKTMRFNVVRKMDSLHYKLAFFAIVSHFQQLGQIHQLSMESVHYILKCMPLESTFLQQFLNQHPVM